MAKASTERPAPAKVKAASPPAAVGKKAKTSGKPKKKAAAKRAPPKMVAAPRKAPAKGPPGKAAAKRPLVKQAGAAKPAPKPAVSARKAGAAAKPAVKAAVRGKSAAKMVAVKTAAPRRLTARTAVPIPAARRGRSPAAAAKPATRLGAGTPQVFTVSHWNEADFKTDGLRAYAQYRDLGIAAATGGLCQAHVIRLVPPCTAEVRKRHQHQADLQLVYVLKGWMKNEFEGHGEQMMSAGSCWLQPSGIKHTVLDYSPDCEVLEIIVPADFKTEKAA
jgi:hypothetical protein